MSLSLSLSLSLSRVAVATNSECMKKKRKKEKKKNIYHVEEEDAEDTLGIGGGRDVAEPDGWKYRVHKIKRHLDICIYQMKYM